MHLNAPRAPWFRIGAVRALPLVLKSKCFPLLACFYSFHSAAPSQLPEVLFGCLVSPLVFHSCLFYYLLPLLLDPDYLAFGPSKLHKIDAFAIIHLWSSATAYTFASPITGYRFASGAGQSSCSTRALYFLINLFSAQRTDHFYGFTEPASDESLNRWGILFSLGTLQFLSPSGRPACGRIQ